MSDREQGRPERRPHVNTRLLKVKLAVSIVSIVSISSIHLLRTFIEVGDIGAPDQESDIGHTSTGAPLVSATPVTGYIVDGRFIPSA